MWKLLFVFRIGLLICIIGKTQSCYDIVEKGETTAFTCTLPNNSTVITWQAVTGSNTLNLTTCNMASRRCTDQQMSVYQGRVLNSAQGTYTVELGVKSARINETRFRCVNDVGAVSDVCGLEVYVWPTPPVCEPMKLDNKTLSLELTCTSSNVYPQFSTLINSIGPPGFKLEVDLNNSVCNVSPLGSGSPGDVSETCTWRIPTSKMPPEVYYFYIAVTPFVTNSTILTKSAVTSKNVTADLRLPRPVVYIPVGPGVVGDYIKVGTSATCRCEIDKVGLWDGQAQWFDADGHSVGIDNPSDRSSVLTLSYNSSDPDVTYQCRGINPTSQYYFYTYKPKFTSPDCHVFVEKGQSTHLDCPVQGSINSVTWQLWTGAQYVNVSTCPLAGTCDNRMPQMYTGHVLNSPGGQMFSLNISNARSNETQFRCLADDTNVVKICTLEPYRYPSIPAKGGVSLTNQYAEVTFSTVAYPDVRAVLHRRKTEVNDSDITSKYCSRSLVSTDPNSDYRIVCTWRIPIAKMLLSNQFYAEMSLLVTNETLVNRPPVISSDSNLDIGSVGVSYSCPRQIKKGTSATCKCTATSSGFITAKAQWFKAGQKIVGVEDTLIVSFNSSDPNPSYECRGINPTGEYTFVTYEPTFSSAVHLCAITWMVFLLAACTTASSTLF